MIDLVHRLYSLKLNYPNEYSLYKCQQGNSLFSTTFYIILNLMSKRWWGSYLHYHDIYELYEKIVCDFFDTTLGNMDCFFHFLNNPEQFLIKFSKSLNDEKEQKQVKIM